MVDELFFGAVPVEPGDCRQTPSDRRPCPPGLLEPTGEQFNMGPPHLKQVNVMVQTPL
jgi:hypothetical protein